MRRKSKIATTVLVGLVILAIALGIWFWHARSTQTAGSTVMEVQESMQDAQPEVGTLESAPVDEEEEEEVTRIIIESADDRDSEIQEMLSEKVIINEEVKSIRDIKSQKAQE